MAEWAGGKTGTGRPGGAFHDLSALDLGALAAREALRRTQTAPEEIDHVVVGNALQTSPDAIYGARHVGLKAGVPQDRPALTVNRLCGSGIEAVVQAEHLIQRGEAHKVLAGGMESMSQAPFVVRGARRGFKMGDFQLEDSLLASLMDTYSHCYMAHTAENLARDHDIAREAQDEFALRSFQRAEKAIETGLFADEVMPVELKDRKGNVTLFEHDDHFFPNCTLEGLSKLRPAFGKDGFVTAGNASGVVDGAAMVVVVGEKDIPPGATPLARVVAHSVVGVDPTRMGIGPVPAIRAVLDKAKLSLDDVDRFEINEAFSAQYLAVEKELGLDRDKVNVNGGAIAIGHPLGATGTRLLLTLALELKRSRGKWGVASACIGGGQGIAMVIESA
jgi:acetyl-CoA C-acetyltransferase/acetyl-CoA acyltransferase 2